LTLSILFVAASFVCVKYIKKEFLPVQDQSMFMARVSMPVGTSLKYTDEQTKKAEEWLLKQPEIQGLYVAVGGFSGGASDAHTAIMFVTLKPKKERSVSQQDFMERARTELKKIENAKFSLQDLSARGFGGRGRGYAIEFSVLGPNWEKLAGQAQAIMKEMEDSGQFVDLDSNYLVGLPEIQMRPDRIRAALHGVSIRSIGKTVNSLIGGEKVGQYAQDGRRYDVRLQVEKTMDPKAGLDRLLIANSQGNLISISEVVNKVDGKSLQSISRENRQRSITVYANLPKTVSADLGMKKVREISQKILEPGYMIGESGSSKNMSESFSGLGFALVMGLLVAYMVLASQFKSFIDPVTVLMALPFSISGAFFALLLTSQSFNIYSMIGILLLMGIVKKNSILLVEFTNVVRERNHGTALGSLIEACPIRLRPILMTSIATMAGALPSALAWGEGAEAFRPMAVTIIGGVFVSTVLTLIVIPCFYLIVDRFRTSHRDQEELSSAFKEVESHP
jgi:HAE1 family hydrophobic/amphiphilic exporter-1